MFAKCIYIYIKSNYIGSIKSKKGNNLKFKSITKVFVVIIDSFFFVKNVCDNINNCDDDANKFNIIISYTTIVIIILQAAVEIIVI